jgi:hypothetical protein
MHIRCPTLIRRTALSALGGLLPIKRQGPVAIHLAASPTRGSDLGTRSSLETALWEVAPALSEDLPSPGGFGDPRAEPTLRPSVSLPPETRDLLVLGEAGAQVAAACSVMNTILTFHSHRPRAGRCNPDRRAWSPCRFRGVRQCDFQDPFQCEVVMLESVEDCSSLMPRRVVDFEPRRLGANPGTDSQFPANCAGNSVSVPGLRRLED